MTYETTISTSATTTYSLPGDLYEIVNNTFWSRTEIEEVMPLSEQEWQYQKGVGQVSALVPEYRFEYTQGTPSLVFIEAPGTQVYVLEYRSTNWVVNTSGSATAALWTNEGERTQLDEYLFYTELKWRWLRSKGSDYSQEFAAAEIQRDSEIARDMGGGRKLSLVGDYSGYGY